MDELRAAHVCNSNAGDVIENNISVETTVAKKNAINDVNEVSAVNKVWSGDKRLSLYSYTLETINLLLLPMVQTKYVPQYIFFSHTHTKHHILSLIFHIKQQISINIKFV